MKKKNLNISLLVFFVLLSNSFLFSQKYNFKKISVENGLPEGTVYDICQDKQNYIWTATNGGGVARYDGNHFKVYNKEKGLTGNVVKNIELDSEDRLWAATNNGLFFLEKDSFINFPLLKDKPCYILSLHISGNTLYAGTSENGFFEINIKTKKCHQYNTDNSNLSSNWVFDLLSDENGNVWIATYGGGLNCMSKDKTIRSFQTGLNCLSLGFIKSGVIACGTRQEGYFTFNPSSSTQEDFLKKIDLKLKGEDIWSITKINDAIFLCTLENGVLQLNKNEQVFAQFKKESGLQSNQIFKVFLDNEKNLWFISSNSGLLKFLGYGFIHFDKQILPSSSGVTALSRSSANTFLAGTSDGLFELSKTDDLNYSVRKVSAFENVSISALHNNKNNTYIGTDANGFYVVTSNGKKTQVTEDDGLVNQGVSCFFSNEADQSLWVGTNGGVSVFKNERHQFSMSENNGLLNNEIYKIDNVDNNIVIASNGGLTLLDGTWTRNFTEKEGLLEKRIHTFCSNKKGILYLGTFGDGIYVADGNITEVKSFKKLENTKLRSENIYSLFFCNDTLLAAATDRGLNLLVVKNNTVTQSYYYSNQNGFEGIECNLNASYADQPDHFFIGTINGVSVLNLDQLSFKLYSPKVVVDTIKIGGNYFDAFPAELKHNANNLELSIRLIGFSGSDQAKLMYKLEGYDEVFNSVPSSSFSENGIVILKFNKLPPGEYKLTLRGFVSDNEVPTEQSFSFSISAPFWTTWWFIVLMIGAITLLVITVVRIRLRVLKNQNIALENTVQERTKEIVFQKDEIESQRKLLSHKNQEITDSINYAQNIQNSMLPEIGELEKKHSNMFVIFQPKDIVSGDFYWMNKVENSESQLLIAAADCTGHGVPGAFMSLIGIEKLNDCSQKSTSPATILTSLNNAVKNALKQNSMSNAKDGMDIAFLHIKENELTYSGANRPLYILKNGSKEIGEIKADKVAIGGFTEFNYPFSEHTISLSKGDAVYVFSDGFADQFGGDKGKKLMTKKFKEMLLESAGMSMKDQKDFIYKMFTEWKTGFDQVDDVLVIGYRF